MSSSECSEESRSPVAVQGTIGQEVLSTEELSPLVERTLGPPLWEWTDRGKIPLEICVAFL
jgi:hypothetical protein